jgi:transcription-repair coupling factor (superfamily II helicase)
MLQANGSRSNPGLTVVSRSPLDTVRGWIEGGEKRVEISGLTGSAAAWFISRMLHNIRRPCLVVAPGRKDAERLQRELSFFMSDRRNSDDDCPDRIQTFPPYEITPLAGLSPHGRVVSRRIRSLFSLLEGKDPVVVTSIEALCFRTLPKQAFINAVDYLASGEEADRDRLIERVEAFGYERSPLVEEYGDYSVRGGVIDLYSPLYPLPVRLEFNGDHIESMRKFDPVGQRSRGMLDEALILPACEVIMDEAGLRRARSMGRLPQPYETEKRFPGQEAWLRHFYESLDTVFDYFPNDGIIVALEPRRFDRTASGILDTFETDVEKFRLEAAEKGSPFPEAEGLTVDAAKLYDLIDGLQKIEIDPLVLNHAGDSVSRFEVSGLLNDSEELDIRLASKGRVSLSPLAEKTARRLSSGDCVVVVSRTEKQAARLKDIFENYDVTGGRIVDAWADIPAGAGLYFCIGTLTRGFAWAETGLYVVTEDEIFGARRRRVSRGSRARENGIKWSSFSQIKPGDFVVHEDHGIGRYSGLVTMDVNSRVGDFVIVEYAGSDKLYVPADRIRVLQLYAGADERDPKLDQLGGRSWNAVKTKAKKSVKRIARQLVELYALRKHRSGFSFSPPDNFFREFEATFEHEETPDQVKAIEDVLEDMTSERPMDRLICGDVGFGKTEIALRAAFKAVSDGKQVAVLVPTTLLAEQHYETFKPRLEPFGVRVGVLSRFKTRAEQSELLAKLRSGGVDVVVGTHRLLQKDVEFKDLGLLVVDEEQRFGVKQKEALKKYRSLVDVLALTATPVPRTLHMSMMGVRDLTVIETPPQDRFSVETYLSSYDEGLISGALERELARGGQVFFVHNRVQTIEAVADSLRRLLPGARFAVAHGQMNESELEHTMKEFLSRKIDVLVCTTIIDSGLDIPSANTIIINEVDRMGLAQVYQLRGRVGRANEKAYAYLLLSNGSNLTRDAEKRLQALMDFSHLGAGLHLAMHDLKIRGGGNILGFAQSGHISAVGYELYIKLIEQAVAELKGEEWHEEVDPEIHMDLPAYLPESYIKDMDLRLNIYRRLSRVGVAEELSAMREEIRDRFGHLPVEVTNLLDIMSLRLVLKKHGIARLDVSPGNLLLTFSPHAVMDSERLVSLVSAAPHKFRMHSQYKLRVGLARSRPDVPAVKDALADFDFLS